MRLFTVALSCLVLLSVLVGCRSHHDTEAFYQTRTDAEKSGEFRRGWLPDFLPTTSRNIHLAYDLSPSRVWCAFEFYDSEKDTFLRNLKRADAPVPTIARVPRHIKWWPKSFEGSLDAQKIRDEGFALYSGTRSATQTQNETWLFAIDSRNRRGYMFGR